MFRKIMKQIQKLAQGSSERRHSHYRRGSSSDRRNRHYHRDSSSDRRNRYYHKDSSRIVEIAIITKVAAAADMINVHHLVEVTTTNAGDEVAANPH